MTDSDFSQPTPPLVITELQLSALIQTPARSLQRWRCTGAGPAFVRTGPRRVGYRMIDVTAWLEARTFSHRAEELASLRTRDKT